MTRKKGGDGLGWKAEWIKEGEKEMAKFFLLFSVE